MTQQNVTQKLIDAHRVNGAARPGEPVELRIDQTLTQDATGTMVMLMLEAMQLDRVRTELSAQYVDHNLLQEDHRNPDDHLFLESACRRFGVWYSPPGNGVSHPVHQERFGVPGKTLLGSDSHTPAAGAIGMLAIGAGGMDVAMAMAGEPYHLDMPRIWGVELTGHLPAWVSAKDVILEMLRRHGVDGGAGRIIEYYGPGLAALSVMDRHVIANMGTELGATTTVFPSDDVVRAFLRSQGREHDWVELTADPGARYDCHDRIALNDLEPLIAMPSSPGNVHPVREVAGQPIYQAYVGSSANPGYRDFAVAAHVVHGRRVAPGVSFDINPTSRQILENLVEDGHLARLIHAGARIHQAGCNGCIGMGQAPATERLSLRTVPRNFPGRSGTREDRVCLVSPETAAASAIAGVITDPRDLDMTCPIAREPARPRLNVDLLQPPTRPDAANGAQLLKGPNIASVPLFDPLPDDLHIPILLRCGDDVSTDEILPAGSRVLPYRSNVPAISRFACEGVDDTYASRAAERGAAHAIVAGRNYGQGSSREHAALALAYLGLRVVVAESIARIHRDNLVNCAVLPLTLESGDALERLQRGAPVRLRGVHDRLRRSKRVVVETGEDATEVHCRHDLSARQIDILLAGGLVRYAHGRLSKTDGGAD